MLARRRPVANVLVALLSGGVLVSACQLAFDTDILTSERNGLGPVDAGDGPDRRTDRPDSEAPGDSGPEPSLPLFSDDFDREDSPSIGNGWIEKNDEAWEIRSKRATKVAAQRNYRDNLVYRTDVELLDMDIAADVVMSTSPPGSPSLHARIRPSSVATPGILDSYCLFVLNYPTNSPNTVIMGRQRNAASCVELTRITFPDFQPGKTYRMRLRVEGTDPVRLTGTIAEKTGPGSYQVIGESTATDDHEDRLTTPGWFGFSGDTSSDLKYSLSLFEARKVE